MNRQLDQQKSLNSPARRNARSDPPPRLAGHGVLDSYFCLVSAVSDLLSRVFFLSSGCSFTLLKGSRRVQHSARPTSLTLLERIFFVSFFRPRFLSFFSPFWRPFGLPKLTPKPEKIGKNGSSNPSPVLLQFFCRFSLKFGRSSKGRTLDFARPYGTLATFLHFHLSAVGSPLGSVLASKNLPKTAPKSTPSLKKRLPKWTSKMTSNLDAIFLDFGLQNGGQNYWTVVYAPPFWRSKCVS